MIGKKNKALLRAIAIVAVLGALSWFTLDLYNQEIDPELAFSVDVAKVGQKILEVFVDFIVDLVNPERRSR